MVDARELRLLAAWYREFAEKAGNPAIWDWRLRTAENLEVEAERMSARSQTRAETVLLVPDRIL